MKTTATFTGPLMPDLPDRDNPGVVKAENCLPLAKSFEPFRTHLPDMDALPNPCIGASSIQDYNLVTYSYAGTVDDIYQRVSNTWIPRGEGAYSPNRWEFDTLNDKVFAVNGVDLIQEAVPGGTFAGNPDPNAPNPAHIGTSRQFVITGNQPGDPRKVQWSALGNGEIWTSDGTNSAGEQVLQRGGAITGVVGGEYATIFCEHSIHVMRFIGGAIIWQFDEVVPGRGTTAPGSIAQLGNDIYYIDSDGFWIFNGIQSSPIGSGIMNQTWLEDYDDTKPNAISSLIDLENTLIYWAYPGDGNTGIANKIMAYNYSQDRWSGPIAFECEQLSYAQLPSTLSDGLTPPQTDLSDDHPELSDSQEYKGGAAGVSAFDKNHFHGAFTGPVMTARIETGEFSINPGGKAMVRSVRALVDGPAPNVSVCVGVRNSAAGPVSYGPDKTAYPETGKAKFRANARFHRICLTVDGDYTHAFGVEPEAGLTSGR